MLPKVGTWVSGMLRVRKSCISMSNTLSVSQVESLLQTVQRTWATRANSEEEVVLAITLWTTIAKPWLDEADKSGWGVSGLYSHSTRLLVLGSSLQDGLHEILNNKDRCRN